MKHGTDPSTVVGKVATQRGFIGLGNNGTGRKAGRQKGLSRAIGRIWPTLGCFERCATAYKGAYPAMMHCGLDCVRQSMRKFLDLIYQEPLCQDPEVKRLKKAMRQMEKTTEDIKKNVYKKANV